VHNHGHQLEAILAHVNHLQVGNTNLFWRLFVGQDNQGNFTTGRCGWTHMPPNTTNHYDYLNPALVASDIADWRPDGGGATTLVNLNTWGDLPYPWPEDPDGIGQRIESQWYIYWMQAMPGFGNEIAYSSQPMTNWWQFTAYWDAAINAGLGLYGDPVNVPGAEDVASAPLLRAAYPNPFNPQTTIAYELPEAGRASLTVHDVTGRRVATLFDAELPAGPGSIAWNGEDSARHPAASGVYVAVLRTQSARQAVRLVLVR
jgi:hypothetical protein